MTRRGLTLAVAALCTASFTAAPARAVADHHGGAPTAHHRKGTPTVGALFVPGLYPTLHTCTASVIRSRHRDVIMTAAHCVQGSGKGYVFAPGYDNGSTPYGTWPVTRAYGDTQWIHHQNPRRDWAFLTVASQQRNGKTVALQARTGGNRLGHTPATGTHVDVVGYPLGAADRPVSCRTRVSRHGRYPEFGCDGFTDGTSGSPWLARHGTRREVDGVIGGLHQGGCSSARSYSAPLGKPARAAFHRAEHRATGDRFPTAGSDGC